jgi:hypothetical protein
VSHLFEKILVPVEKVVEVRRGRKVDAERKFFPGYVMVRADLTDDAFHLIKNTPKVTGFLGSDSKPVPIPDSEAERILTQVQEGVERPKPSIAFRDRRAGARVRWTRSHRSTAQSRKSTRSVRASRSRFPSSDGRPRSNLNTVRSRRSDIEFPGLRNL